VTDVTPDVCRWVNRQRKPVQTLFSIRAHHRSGEDARLSGNEVLSSQRDVDMLDRKMPWQEASTLMTRSTTQAISPFFIVSNVDQTIAFYRDRLGFETRFQQPERNPFFAIIGRDGAQIFIKSDKGTPPLPNPKRCPSMRWDAFVYTADPDALAAEFGDRGAAFSAPLEDTHDGLRGFEISDPDGYVLFFGRPRS